jgi:hypothetical protein
MFLFATVTMAPFPKLNALYFLIFRVPEYSEL